MNVYKVRPMDLHAQSEHCGEACIAVVIATEHHVEVQHLKDLGQRVDDQLIEAQRKLEEVSKLHRIALEAGEAMYKNMVTAQHRANEAESKLGKRSAQLVEALRVSNEQGSRLHSAELLLSETIEYLPIGGTAQIRARVQAHFLSAVVEKLNTSTGENNG